MPSASQDADVEMQDASPAVDQTKGHIQEAEEPGPQDRFMKDTSQRLRVVSPDPPKISQARGDVDGKGLDSI